MTVLILVLCLFSGLKLVNTYTEFPNPQKEWRMCGRSRPSFVCDPEFVLQLGDAEHLDQIAAEFRRSTSCPCNDCPENQGVSLGIFIKSNVSNDSIAKYPSGKKLSEMLRRRWGLSKCDGDIIIILLTLQNISDFSLGPAVQKILPESTAQQILTDCRVHFDSGWYYQGLESIANSLNDVLIRLQKRPVPTFKNMILGIGLGFGVLFVLAVVAILLLNRQSRKRAKSRCSDIYESVPTTNNHRKLSFNRETHLEKLSKLSEEDDEDDEDDGSCRQFDFKKPQNHLSVQFMRLQRQLSDVTEESEEADNSLRNSSYTTSYGSSYQSPKDRSIPVTEL